MSAPEREPVLVCVCTCHANHDPKQRDPGGHLCGHPAPAVGTPLATVTLGLVAGGKPGKPLPYCLECALVLLMSHAHLLAYNARSRERMAAVSMLIEASKRRPTP